MIKKINLLLLLAVLAACDSGHDPAGDAASDPATTAAPAAAPAETPVSAPDGTLDAANWPAQDPVMARDAEMEQRIADLISRMTLEEKVGQVIQADINAVTPDEVRDYNLGSILNGGGSAPGGDNRTTPDKWLELADAFWDASTDTSDGGVGIPAIWGTDAVHGHSNILGATLFPHNIGLGMANDPELLRRIGRATALEILATGLDWTFAPTVAVARNDRWGRTYESYSEDPRIVAAYAPVIVEGIQGRLGTSEFLDEDHILATAKHFVGDGGTTDGHDQGDMAGSEAELRDIHAAGYPPAIAAGVQSVMASFNSFHGRKMHGSRTMLNDVLVGRMGFDGFVVGDWNGHGQVAGCSNTSCAQSFNAGLDMFMAPNSWKGVYESLLEQVRSGEVTMQRLDEAVARILRVKMRFGLFEAGRPSSRKHAGNFALLAAPEHRAIAREAVRKSLVLLKNENGLLPLAPDVDVLVTGDGAHNIGKQSGGWTLNWQGTNNLREHFPNGESIFEGIQAAVTASGGTAVLSDDGRYDSRPDVAIVVFGEDPYAEGVGDRGHVAYDSEDGLELLTRLQGDGIPTVSVFISGRPLWVNREINASDAFVAAWLPGSEGGGVADVLIGNPDGSPRHDFTGRLSFSWPMRADQAELNVGDADYDPLFAYGYGLAYEEEASVGTLPTDPGIALGVDRGAGELLEFGDPAGDWRMALRDEQGAAMLDDSRGASPAGVVVAEPADREVQADSILVTWSGPGSVVLTGESVNLSQSADNMALEVTYQVRDIEDATVTVGVGSGRLDVTDRFVTEANDGWKRIVFGLACFVGGSTPLNDVTEPLVIESTGTLQLQLTSAQIVANLGGAGCE
ncbi:MAG: glycoside hydrolase family 3 N-terminal domain-containing protein [Woeseiaceae bacterium]